MVQLPGPATRPTIYFIGVTTGKSSIMKVFPKWAEALGIDAVIKGIDIRIHADAQDYIDTVNFIKNDPLSQGALVTTHKIDLFKATHHLFDYVDPYAEKLEEISSISKRGKELRCHAKDPISSGLAMEAFIPEDYWKVYGGDVLLLGAGGSSLAMSLYLTQEKWGDNVPGRIIIANRSKPRLESAREKLENIHPNVKFEFLHGPTPRDNDRIMGGLKPYSLVVNATGLGKDAPGSPVTDEGVFPKNGLVWEINYRGDLLFMEQALRQKEKRRLHVEDGWIYFVHGWTQVVGEVFDIPIVGEKLKRCNDIAFEVEQKRRKKPAVDTSKPGLFAFDLKNGLSPERETTKRYLHSLRGLVADEDALEEMIAREDKLVYEYYEMGVPEAPNELGFGTSICYPGKVGCEYFMTKGHFHNILDTSELFLCLQGRGLLLMESPEGDVAYEILTPGKTVYVPKRYAHRSVNIGDEPFVQYFCSRGDAGHDYGTVEARGFRKMVVEKDGDFAVVDNPKWK